MAAFGQAISQHTTIQELEGVSTSVRTLIDTLQNDVIVVRLIPGDTPWGSPGPIYTCSI